MMRRLFLVAVTGALMVALAASTGLAQDTAGDPFTIQGTITDIQNRTVLVEENPSASGTGDKGYFNVTEETEIVRQQGDETVPASFEELSVGQLVEATYAGAVGASYPSVGDAERIVILEESSDSNGDQQQDQQPQCFLPEGCFLSGDGSAEKIVGGTGPDYIIGGGGNDALHGLGGGDWLDGGAGEDLVRGNEGDDLVDGSSGHDLVIGGPGNDYVTGFTGSDILNGGGGSDFIYAADGEFDRVSGGPGYDVCIAGFEDEVPFGGITGCEEIYRR